jgi:hypothetical protein
VSPPEWAEPRTSCRRHTAPMPPADPPPSRTRDGIAQVLKREGRGRAQIVATVLRSA